MKIFNFFKKNKSHKEENHKKINDKIDWYINESILTFHTGEAFMHYFNENSKVNKQNPAWKNQGVFFWKEKESFEKKSLPDEFLNFKTKLFFINEIPDYIDIKLGKAIPWFGKPGGGDKMFFEYNDMQITIEEAKDLGIIQYFKYVKLNEKNLNILNDKENYIFRIDSSVEYKNNYFFLENNKVSLSELYRKELIKIIELK